MDIITRDHRFGWISANFIKVAKEVDEGADHLSLLGVAFDRRLHFGHTAAISASASGRTPRLRKLTGRNGRTDNVHRVLWLLRLDGSRLLLRPTWRCWRGGHGRRSARSQLLALYSGPRLDAEAGLLQGSARRTTPTAKLLAKAYALPDGDLPENGGGGGSTTG